ncbi:MAG: hypothetical protein JKY54_16220 [Flavobacteriales bacterium]|nr:hypothetical protein [Flavobacteriales bacterium]
MRAKPNNFVFDFSLKTSYNTDTENHHNHTKCYTNGCKKYDRLRKAIGFFTTFSDPFSYEIFGVQ